jgi:glycosyltransferase involved in cell wall biosynthesis
MSTSTLRVDVVVPVHNEADCVHDFGREFLEQALVTYPFLRLILVENGSNDRTFEECERLKSSFPSNVVVLRAERPSYGNALRVGMRTADAPYLVILEVDYLDLAFVNHSMKSLANDSFEVVIGSKRHPESRDERPRKRLFLTLAYNLLLKVLFGFSGTDTHGLKAFNAGAAKHLLGISRTADESFQTEIVLLSEKLKMRKTEVPVVIREKRPTPVSIMKRLPKVARSFIDLRRSLSRPTAELVQAQVKQS